MSTREEVDTLENALKELAYAGRKTEMSLDRFSGGLEEVRQLIRANAAEIKETAVQLKETDAQMKETDTRIRTLEANLEKSRVEREQAFHRMDLEWGRLANKMGTFVEDMVLPNFPHILERYFEILAVDDMLVRRKKPHPTDKSRRKEFDLIAWTGDTVFLNETKSNPSIQAFTEFVRDNKSVFEYFPELSGRRLVKIAGALDMDPDLIAFLTENGCYAMMLGDETMDLVNFDRITVG